MVMLMKKSVLLAKAETVYGTDPTPTGAANAILVYEADVKETHEAIERNVQWNFLGRPASLKGESYCEVSFKVDVVGSGSVALAPRIGAVLKACGLAETIQSGASVTYTPTSSPTNSVTLYLYKDGRLHTITGARGNVKLTYDSGKPLTAEFTMKGIYADPSVAANATCTYESTATNPPVCKSSAFTYNSKTTLVTKTVELDFGNTVAKRQSLNAATGVAGFEVTDRKPTVSVDPECQVETSYTFRTDMLNGALKQISVVATRAAGNIVTLTVPKFNITKVEYADREGILVEKLEGEACVNTTDDDFTIVFS
jgi:hypothetical protein